jgi:hypothetical protein
MCYGIRLVLESSCSFLQVLWQVLHRSSTKAGSGSNRTRRIHQLLISETRKAESSFSTLPGDQKYPTTHPQGKVCDHVSSPPCSRHCSSNASTLPASTAILSVQPLSGVLSLLQSLHTYPSSYLTSHSFHSHGPRHGLDS